MRDIAFMFVDTAHYLKYSYPSDSYIINIYTTDTLNSEQVVSLGKLLTNCIIYFSANIAPYKYKEFNIVCMKTILPVSMYCGGFARINSSALFCDYVPVHELTHEWAGHTVQTTIGSRGEFLIGESLTEYLKCQFLKYYEGDSVYGKILDNFEQQYKDYLSKKRDTSIMNITKCVKSEYPIIMYKQVLLLDTLAQTIGHDNLNNTIFFFLKQNIDKKVTAEQFLDFLRMAYRNTHKEEIEKYVNSI
jgi:hypothetical protein